MEVRTRDASRVGPPCQWGYLSCEVRLSVAFATSPVPPACVGAPRRTDCWWPGRAVARVPQNCAEVQQMLVFVLPEIPWRPGVGQREGHLPSGLVVAPRGGAILRRARNGAHVA